MRAGKVHRTVEVSNTVLYDLDKKGNALGIELLNASRQVSPRSLKNGLTKGIPFNLLSATPIVA